MSDTLRDQLLGLGFKPAPQAPQPPKAGKPAHHVAGRPGGGKPHGRKPHERKTQGAHAPAGRPAQARPRQDARPGPRTAGHAPSPRRGEMDLAKAYAIRAQKEKDERIEAERQKQEAARARREAKAALATLLTGKALNVPEADIARHFEYGGKIKRIHVTAAQLQRLNAGELGVVQVDGRYLLVDAATLAAAEAVFAPAVALKIDPDAPASDDPYADPQYQVPDDLVW